MLRKYKELICCFLSCIVLLTGIGAERTEIDFGVFNSALGHHSEFLFQENKEKIYTPEVCVREILGTPESVFIRENVKCPRRGAGRRNSISLLDVKMTPRFHLFLHKIIGKMHFHKLLGKTVIINYMHDQDGKK